MTTINDPAQCDHYEAFARCAMCAREAKGAGGAKLQAWFDARGDWNARRFPRRYQGARADHPSVLAWAAAFADQRDETRSLLIAGPVGSGKTHQAYGALRSAASCGRNLAWQAVPFADFCAELRPSSGDPEGALRRYRDAELLLVDDLGAAKNSEWVEETTYRLINARYEAMRATIFTTNLALPQLAGGLGDRIASRLVEICDVVPLVGADRRRAA
jgi:DNA replication protein DnaC